MKIPLTLRFAFHGFRSAMRAALLFFCAWLIFIPANAEEQAALGAAADEKYPFGLRPMRSARAVIAIAPDRFYVMAAGMLGEGVSPLFVRIAMTQLATGAGKPATMRTESGIQSDRDIDGPRFIQVD
ncbi:hypothetical protein [Loktanella sp. Alg231-35]|uniref:hypothetical protein n=1 Tax=Loktanella sp. Alg231-35 TaxID=1922220 RepID=UPI00131F1EE9|nr:hypothetical protein [Loktanella sp. Alg231-35]